MQHILKVITFVITLAITLAIIMTIRSIPNPTVPPMHVSNADYALALDESDGFFADIREQDWLRYKSRFHSLPNFKDNGAPGRSEAWFTDNFEPSFSCPHERRIGGMGDGPKWVCDPHRIDTSDCLVYSIGSNNDFSFEEAIHEAISERCEIHTFDMTIGEHPSKKPSYVHFHPWGLAAQDDETHRLKTLRSTVKALGHEGRMVDIFKIDCEGCEFQIYNDWIHSGITMRQILMEVHAGGSKAAPENPNTTPAGEMLKALQRMGYVVFHKEANLLASVAYRRVSVEYALLKLEPRFQSKQMARPRTQPNSSVVTSLQKDKALSSPHSVDVASNCGTELGRTIFHCGTRGNGLTEVSSALKAVLPEYSWIDLHSLERTHSRAWAGWMAISNNLPSGDCDIVLMPLDVGRCSVNVHRWITQQFNGKCLLITGEDRGAPHAHDTTVFMGPISRSDPNPNFLQMMYLQ